MIRNWIKEVARSESKQTGDLVFIFCSDEFLLNMNKEYLQHDYYTDIITFDYSDNGRVAGEMYISHDRVLDNAKNLNISELDELHRVIIHGVLHLCGYKDKTKKEEILMRFAEDKALKMRPLPLFGL